MKWFVKVVQTFSFRGRARRKEYWMFALFVFLITLLLGFLDVAVLGTYSETLELGLLGGVFILTILIQSIAVGVRRLHDTGRSGWWLLVSLIPIAGPIIVLVLAVLEGQAGENPYGPDPKQAM